MKPSEENRYPPFDLRHNTIPRALSLLSQSPLMLIHRRWQILLKLMDHFKLNTIQVGV